MSGVRKAGFTLVELLVVIAIIGILVSLLLPAVQSARESGRRNTCSNNVKQLALAANLHREKYGFFPTGGWGWGWAGEPDRGFTKNQPGGWCYNILPFVDQVNLWQMGRDSDSSKKMTIAKRAGTPLAVLHCPTRRRPIQYPFYGDAGGNKDYINATVLSTGLIGRTDYAANGGDSVGGWSYGPGTIAEGEGYGWGSAATGTGICTLHGEVKTVPDGESNTYLIGERYCNPDYYISGRTGTDDQGWDIGFDHDTVRWGNTSKPPRQDTPGDNAPSQSFGSAHTAGWNVSFCDGRVKLLSYDIDPATHGYLANRKDATPIDQSKLE